LNALRADATTTLHDGLAGQLEELAELRDPMLSDADRQAARAGADDPGAGVWIHYPWRRTVVRTLAEQDFVRVRTNRNMLRIDAAEQAKLRSLTIGVVGLSVGRAAALTLAQEGIGGCFRLADFDTLELSNLNRVRAPLWELGENKAVACARELLAIDPWLRIDVFEAGVQPEDIDAFLSRDGAQLDLLVEECDDLAVKVLVRERARALGIPVLMATSEAGLLDVERFDLDGTLPLFHGRAGELDAAQLRGLSKSDKVPIVLRILGADRLSDRTVASLLEIEASLVTWPQLASAVALGGAMVADAARRIALGEFTASGRFSADFDALVSNEAVAAAEPYQPLEDQRAFEQRSHDLGGRGRLSREAVIAAIDAACQAPSGGNLQPWRYRFGSPVDGAVTIDAFFDRTLTSPFLDFDYQGTWLGFGAAAENLRLRAAALGLRAELAAFPQGMGEHEPVFRAALRPEPSIPVDSLHEGIEARCTNRRRSPRQPLPEGLREAMERSVADIGGTLLWRDAPETIAELSAVLADSDRVRLLNETLHVELMREMRWNAKEAAQTRDGLDIATLELERGEEAALRLMRRPGAMALLRKVGAGSQLGRLSVKAMKGASAAALICVPRSGETTYFEGGRAVQRAWLAATNAGVAFQPMSAMSYLWLRLFAGGEGLNERDKADLTAQRERFEAVWDIPAGLADIMMVRLHISPPPRARSLRRHVEAMIDG